MATKTRQLCPTCVVEGPWRYSDDGDVLGKCPTCFPVVDDVLETAHRLTADAHTQAFKAAKGIIRDAAEVMPEFSANQIRSEIEAAQIPSPVVGAAFSACVRDGVIEASGRYVQSTDPATRHRIVVWSSRVCRHGASGGAA